MSVDDIENMKIDLPEYRSDKEASKLDGDAAKVARLGLWVLAIGFGGFMLWAGLAPLDQGMAGSGTVVVSGEKKTVQSLVGGAVELILVGDGEMVNQGQTLIRLNKVQAQAQLEAMVGQWINARCLEARLNAERLNQKSITLPKDLQERSDDPRVSATMDLHARLFETRRREFELKLQIIKNELASLNGQLTSFNEIKRHQEMRLAAQEKELDSYRTLVTKGFISWNRVHEVERDMGELNVDLATAISNVGRTQQAIHENQLRELQALQAFRSEIETQLTAVSAEVSMLMERIKGLEFEVDSANIRAPASGQVMDMTAHTVGGVVLAGQRLMDIVPMRSSWVIKAKFPTMAADRLKPGLPVAIRFSSLQRANTPVLTGKVDTVSADQILDEHTRLPYYQVVVKPDQDLLIELGRVGLDVKPGMDVEVLTNTGERTLINYLLKPIFQHMSGALREE
jgi:protease secretion system membrane fusion protein